LFIVRQNEDKENFYHHEGNPSGAAVFAGQKLAGQFFSHNMSSGLRVPLRDITQLMVGTETHTDCLGHHQNSLACLLKCTTWKIDIDDVTDESNPLPIISLVRSHLVTLIGGTKSVF
jgi:hypothetical protein